jgi:hypothetical protein
MNKEIKISYITFAYLEQYLKDPKSLIKNINGKVYFEIGDTLFIRSKI